MRVTKNASVVIACAIASCFGAASSAQSQAVPKSDAVAAVNVATPVSSPAPVAASAAQTPTTSYRINAGDELEVYVWGEERLQRTVHVLPDGTFAFPLVGQIAALGRLPQELERTISEHLRGQYRGQVPQVTVSVKVPSGLQFSVMGRVKSPGNFAPGRYVTVLEALSLAGGPAEFANLDAILIIHKRGDQLTTTRHRLSPLFRAGATEADVAKAQLQRVEVGDTIIVP